MIKYLALGIIGIFITTTHSLGQEMPQPEIQLYPNPFVNEVTIVLKASGDDEVTLEIRNMQGLAQTDQPIVLRVIPDSTTSILLDSLPWGLFVVDLAWRDQEHRMRVMHEDSGSVKINLRGADSSTASDTLLVFPNPIGHRRLSIRIFCSEKQYTLRLITTQGQVLRTEHHTRPAPERGDSVSWFLPNLANGQYVVQLRTAQRTISRRVLVSSTQQP